MSATPSLPDLTTIESSLNLIPDKSTINARWVASRLLSLAKAPSSASSDAQILHDMLRLLLVKIATPKHSKIPTLYAADMQVERIVRLFNLRYDLLQIQEFPWGLIAGEPHTPPKSLEHRIKDLWAAGYDPHCEATCRIAVDFVIIACNLHLRALYPDHFDASKRVSTVDRPTTPDPLPSLLQVYPELDISTVINDPQTHGNIRIAGRADWAFGYNGRDTGAGTFVIAVEAKRRSAMAAAEPQLLTYLALMREQRQAAGKTNPVVQGFYTDGLTYVFMAIQNDGNVKMSMPLMVMNPAQRKTIFNFIITMLESAMKSTPSASPTKHPELRNREVNDYDTEVWMKSYLALIESPVLLPTSEDTLEYEDWDADLEML